MDGAIASHILEHLPGETFVHFLQELYRVCKADAEIGVILPWPRHDIFLNDPTHCRAVMPATLVMLSPRYIDIMAEKGMILTDFGRRWKINFELDQKILYRFDPSVKTDEIEPEELARLGARQNNVIMEWQGTMKVVK